MSDNVVLGTALVLMLVALPLISYGTDNDVSALWWAGLALVALGGLVGPVSRYALDGDDGGEDE
jgi:hypothetical protein